MTTLGYILLAIVMIALLFVLIVLNEIKVILDCMEQRLKRYMVEVAKIMASQGGEEQ